MVLKLCSLNIRVTEEEKKELLEETKKAGLDSLSAYILMILRKFRESQQK